MWRYVCYNVYSIATEQCNCFIQKTVAESLLVSRCICYNVHRIATEQRNCFYSKDRSRISANVKIYENMFIWFLLKIVINMWMVWHVQDVWKICRKENCNVQRITTEHQKNNLNADNQCRTSANVVVNIVVIFAGLLLNIMESLQMSRWL